MNMNMNMNMNIKKTNPLIIDFIDMLPVFVKESNKRLDLYKKNNYNISDYVYNKKKTIFEENNSNNRDYSIYIYDAIKDKKEKDDKDTSKEKMLNNLFEQFSSFR